MESTFDDTLPLPNEVENELLDKAGDKSAALAWLKERGIESRADVALIQYATIWNPDTGRAVVRCKYSV